MASNDSAVRHALRTERSRLCDVLDQLDSAAWQTQSLCADWNVLEVVAHLTLSTRTTVFDFAKGMIRSRGNFDRMEAERARSRARDLAPLESVRQLRADIDSTATAPGGSPIDALTDVIVHSQDIAIPLGIDHPIAAEHAVFALDHVRTSRWYGAEQRVGHATLSAIDADWVGGDGAMIISGTALGLLLAVTGRRAGLPGLSGDGVAALRTALLS